MKSGLDSRNLTSNLQNKNLINNENEENYSNYDELDEFGEMPVDRNKVSSIKIKENDINFLDKRKKGKYSYKKDICITEPKNFIETDINNNIPGPGGHTRNLSSNNIAPITAMFNNVNINCNVTPNKNKPIHFGNYTPTNMNFPQNLYRYNSNLNIKIFIFLLEIFFIIFLRKYYIFYNFLITLTLIT